MTFMGWCCAVRTEKAIVQNKQCWISSSRCAELYDDPKSELELVYKSGGGEGRLG